METKLELVTMHLHGTREIAVREAILNADHDDPFGYLGMHETGNGLIVRALLPQAAGAWLIDARTGEVVAPFEHLHPEGLFAAKLQDRCERFPYRLRVETTRGIEDIDVPNAFLRFWASSTAT